MGGRHAQTYNESKESREGEGKEEDMKSTHPSIFQGSDFRFIMLSISVKSLREKREIFFFLFFATHMHSCLMRLTFSFSSSSSSYSDATLDDDGNCLMI